jgi:hypothetical protein
VPEDHGHVKERGVEREPQEGGEDIEVCAGNVI